MCVVEVRDHWWDWLFCTTVLVFVQSFHMLTVRQIDGQFASYGQDPCNGLDDDCDGVVDKGCPGSRPAPLIAIKPMVGLAGGANQSNRMDPSSVGTAAGAEQPIQVDTTQKNLVAPLLLEEPELASVPND